MTNTHSQLRTVYHKIIKAEVDKYNNIKSLKNLFLEREEIENVVENQKILNELIKGGYILEFTIDGLKLYRSLHMDMAIRAAYGVKPNIKAANRVLEKEIALREEAVLDRNGVRFEDSDEKFLRLKGTVEKIIGPEKTRVLFEGLKDAGYTGLTIYQYDAAMRILTGEKKFHLVSAPTGFGKTFVYLLAALVELLKDGDGVRVVMFYPRKALETDQASEVLTILYHINKRLSEPITVGIFDGNTPGKSKVEEGDYRGISIKVEGEQKKLKITIEKVNGGKRARDLKVKAAVNGEELPWIPITREDIRERPPKLLITNIWSYAHSLIRGDLWDKKYINPETALFIFDEVHTYRENLAGVLRYFIRILEKDISPNARFVLSSATIPNAEKFMEDLGIEKDELVDLTFREEDYSEYIVERKLNLYVMLALRPDASWETFAHELGLFFASIYALGGKPQTLIFVDSVREIERIRNQLEVAAERGKVLSHFDVDDKLNPYSLKPYGELRDFEKVLNVMDYHYSDSPTRYEVEEKLKNGSVGVVYATSTLELGVNYKGVSVVVNLGIPRSVESIVQRMGRAGRDPEKTLYTSLGIVIVRPTPMEYYYAYKGLDAVLNLDNAGIPVSYDNKFVTLFTALLRAMVLKVKGDRKTNITAQKSKKEMLELLKRIWEWYSNNRETILRELGIPTEKSGIEEMLEEFISKISSDMGNIEEACRVKVRVNELRDAIRRVAELAEEVKVILKELNVPENIVEKLNETIERLKAIEGEMEEGEDAKELAEKASETVRRLGEIIYREVLYNSNLDVDDEGLSKIEEKAEKISKMRRERIKRGSERLARIPKVNPFVCEVLGHLEAIEQNPGEYKDINGLALIENIIGIKFLGNEFLDKLVETGVWIPGKWDGRSYRYHDLRTMTFSTMIYRTPPFELGTIPWEDRDNRKITEVVGGRYFWLLQPEDGLKFYGNSEAGNELKEILERYGIGAGTSEYTGSFYNAIRVDYVDVLLLDRPAIVEIDVGDENGYLWIKYGSDYGPNRNLLGEGIKKRILPLYDKLDQGKRVDYRVDSLVNDLRSLSSTITSDRAKIKFNYVWYCTKGMGISTDPWDKKCPFVEWCPRRVNDGKGSCIYWSKRGKRRSFPKAYIWRKVIVPKTLEKRLKRAGPLSLEFVHYYEIAHTPIKFVYDEASVYVPTGPGESVERRFKVKPIGYNAITSMVVLTFKPGIMNAMLRGMYSKDRKLLGLMVYKYALNELVRERGLFALDLKNIERKIKEKADKLMDFEWWDFSKEPLEVREFLKFSRRVLLHSLAHRLVVYLTGKYGFDQNRLTYAIDEDGGRVYIAENSKNDGIGIIETLSNDVKDERRKFLREFFEETLKFFREHDRRIEEEMLEFSLEAAEAIDEKAHNLLIRTKEFNSKLETILKHVNLRAEEVDYITYRFVFREVPADNEGELIGSIRDYERIPHMCYDGCNLCLHIGRDCTESGRQHYTVSKKLLVKFIEVLLGGCVNFEKIRGFGKMLNDIIEDAEEVDAEVAYIDNAGISLIEKLQENGVKINIRTKGNSRDGKVMERLQKLKNVSVTPVKGGYHKKVYRVKYDLGEVTLSGSPNLTEWSLEKNEENVTLMVDFA